MFRAAVKANNSLGTHAKSFMEGGNLVPDTLVLEMIKERVAQEPAGARFLFDGFPRTIEQAKGFQALCEEIGGVITDVLNLDADRNVLIPRLTARRTCKSCGAIYHLIGKPPMQDGVCDIDGGELYQRVDDSEATILNRLDVYTKQTAPLIDFYRELGLIRDIDAGATAEAVGQEALQRLNG